jgi:chromosome segregation ATPase
MGQPRSNHNTITPDFTRANMAPISLDSNAAKAFEDEMRLTFAEKRILDLKRQLCAEYERAQKAEKRAHEAEKTIPTTDIDAMHAMRQQLLQANEEKEAAVAARDKAMEEAKQAKLEAKYLREELEKSQPTIEKLTADLHDARSSRPILDQTAVNQLHTTITARDAKIEHLVDKYETLATKHFDVLSQANKSSETSQSYQLKNEQQAVELKELSTKLAAAESARDRYLFPRRDLNVFCG